MSRATNESTPRLTVGLPVHNGANFLPEALDSLLRQSYLDFEVIIADNASEDETPAICAAYAERDARIRYFRNATNIGAAPNYTRVAEAARGELFKWAAHDDVCAPDFLGRCVAALESNPDAVLAYTQALIIDEDGIVTGRCANRPKLALKSPDARFRDVVSLSSDVHPIFGVVRLEALRSVLPHGRYAGADRALLAGLCLRGRFVEVPDNLFRIRRHSQRYSARFESSHSSAQWWDTAQTRRVTWANWRRLHGFRKAIGGARLSRWERVRCYIALLSWIRGHWKRLALDPVLVLRANMRAPSGQRAKMGQVPERQECQE